MSDGPGWFESRTGLGAALHRFLDERVPGGARWAYVWGSLLLFVLLNQALTGALLMTCYSPSANSAWASVAYIQDQVWLGWFVRGMHSAGASVLVAGLVAHMVQVALFGAYRAPREVNWLTGLLLSLLVFALALTGYLLPWDQKGYWATQVATTLLGAVPLVGPPLQALLQGGREYGNLTVTRFYTLHVFVLPALLALLTVGHVALFRRHGVTPSWRLSDDELRAHATPFWPHQAVRDLAAALLLAGGLVAWVVRTHGAPLDAPADPTSPFDARPEWYFLPLYQLLKYLPGSLEVAAAVGAPLLLLSLLAGLPLVDRGPTRAPSQRRLALALLLGSLAAVAGLAGLALLDDAHDARHREQKAAGRQQAVRARRLALQGVPPAGGVAVYQNDPLEQGRQLFREHCAGCHRLGLLGPRPEDEKGPQLSGLGSRTWLTAFLTAPDHFYGRTKLKGAMKPVELPPEPMADLVEYLQSLSGEARVDGPRARRGAALFEEKNCDLCHERDGKTPGQGPNLGGYGGTPWMRALLSDPASPLYYDDKNDMPAFGKKLTPAELDKLTAFLLSLRAAN